MKAQIFNRSVWVNNGNGRAVAQCVDFSLQIANFNIIESIDYDFPTKGYTKLWLLAESHCAIHSFPEEEKTYLEISSCSLSLLTTFWDHFELTGV